MIEQTIIQEALSSIEMFKGTKSKFEAWTESIEHVVQISAQDRVCITFSKLTSFQLSTANRLKARSPNLCGQSSKDNCPGNTQLFNLIVMQPRLLPY